VHARPETSQTRHICTHAQRRGQRSECIDGMDITPGVTVSDVRHVVVRVEVLPSVFIVHVLLLCAQKQQPFVVPGTHRTRRVRLQAQAAGVSIVSKPA
jgi:hypothetical protein